MSTAWMTIERFENWQVDAKNDFAFFGLSGRYSRRAAEIAKGDLVFTYVSSAISAFADVREVKEAGLKTMRRQTYYSSFAFYFSTNPVLVLPELKWLPIKEVASELDFTRGRKDYRSLLYTSIRKLAEHDGNFLLQRMQQNMPAVESGEKSGRKVQ